MDVRKKLVGLIESARYWGSNTSEEIADKLLDSGVTVQECAYWQYIEDDIDEDNNIQAYCSACGAGDKHATSMIGKVPYCWKCGRKMMQYPSKCDQPETCTAYVPVITNADRIRSLSDEELAEFISGIAYGRKTPWSKVFEEKCCKNCPVTKCEISDYLNPMFLHECDFDEGKCPHGSDVEWWLQQPAEGE